MFKYIYNDETREIKEAESGFVYFKVESPQADVIGEGIARKLSIRELYVGPSRSHQQG